MDVRTVLEIPYTGGKLRHAAQFAMASNALALVMALAVLVLGSVLVLALQVEPASG